MLFNPTKPALSANETAENDLKEITTRKNNEPSLLEQAQQSKDINLLHQYFLRLVNFFKKNNSAEIDTAVRYNTRSVLYYAIACFEAPEVISDLLRRGSSADEKYFDENFEQQSALLAAMQLGNLKAVKTLLKEKPALAFQILRTDSAMPAHFAAETNNVELLEILYACNPEITRSLTHLWMMTPLHSAAIFGQPDAARWLLEHDSALCDVPEGFGGRTPLHYAVSMKPIHPEIVNGNHAEVTRLLLEAGANPKLATSQNCDKPNKRALQLAIEAGNSEGVRQLLLHGALPDAEHPLGDFSELDIEVQIALRLIKYPDIMKSLLEKGTNYDYTTVYSTPPDLTPLQIAAAAGDNDLTGQLLFCGARPSKEHPVDGSKLHVDLQDALALHVNYMENRAKRGQYLNVISTLSVKYLGVNLVPRAHPGPVKLSGGTKIIKNLSTGKDAFSGLTDPEFAAVSDEYGNMSQHLERLLRKNGNSSEGKKEPAKVASAPSSPRPGRSS